MPTLPLKCLPLAAALFTLAALVRPAVATSAEYKVVHWDQVDVQTSGAAHIEGSAGGSTWDLTAAPGWARVKHSFYSCCNSDIRPSAYFQCDDLVFSSPSQSGGTATVRLRLAIEASASGCTANTVGISTTLGGHYRNWGVWHSCDPACSCTSQSSGMFAGMSGTQLSGSFLGEAVEVPLDTPVSLRVDTGTRIGSYQALGRIDARVALSSVEVVFEVESGPSDLTANSVEAGIVDNGWVDPTAVAVGPPLPLRQAWVEASPNPFNPSTTLRFALPSDGPATLELLDLRGRVLRELGGGHFAAGVHELHVDGRDGQGRPLASGAYLVRLRSPSGDAGTKLLLLK